MATEASDIAIYESPSGVVEVRLTGETVWLNQSQLARLFGRERSVIARHIKNVFKDNELEEISVCAKFAQTAPDGKTYQVDHYNLDAIISVGYRVKSREGVRFRQWATRTLNQHLTRGYTLNRQRFEENARELEAALVLVRKAAGSDALSSDQGRGLVDVIARYTQTFLLLQRYDEGLLTEPKGTVGGTLPPIAQARTRIAALKQDLMARGEASELFGRSGRRASNPSSAIWSRLRLASPLIPASNRRPRTCFISSSRITRSATATSASAHSCSSNSSIAMGVCSATMSPLSTISAWQHWRCWSPSPTRSTRTC